MIDALPPGWLMMMGSPLILLLPQRFRSYGVLGLSIISLFLFLILRQTTATFSLFGLELQPVRIDSLSWPFVLVFHIAAIISCIYSLHVSDWRQQIAGLVYAGSGVAAACAGDLISLFVFWEVTAISSVFLIWASGTNASYRSGLRYLIIQVGSGVLLLSGAIIQFVQTQSIAFQGMATNDSGLSLGAWLILAAFGIKAAFPLLHNWLQDAYPQATATGTVFLSAFTTKLAIYALARGFAGFDLLIVIGCVMTLFPILFAVIENDLRRVLTYSLNNQLGFMVVGIGIGTELAINGTVAHAFCHIIYKALLFMSMGAVLYRVGTCKGTELGGLHKSMPWTTFFCMIGAGAISGFPLLSGFVSKSMIISAAGEEHMLWVWLTLLVASAGVMEHSGIKIPFFAFFAHDSGKRVKEAPLNMLVAMGVAASLCVGLGIAYPMLYKILPYSVSEHPYQPYTVPHVVAQVQLLAFAALAFVFLIKFRLYPAEERSTNLDTDWFYRKLAPKVVLTLGAGIFSVDKRLRILGMGTGKLLQNGMQSLFGDRGKLGIAWSTNAMAFWATLLLVVALLMNYLNMQR